MDKRIWLGAAVAVTFFFGILYVAVQQALRLGANDPQISMVQDAAAALKQNRKPADLFSGHVEMSYSMAPFVIVYDKLGNAVASNGYLDGKIPTIPFGVLQHTPEQGAHAVTWEPKPGVRIASVSAQAGDYYAVGGRSLTVVEGHIESLTAYMLGAWLLTMVAGGAACFFITQPLKSKNQK
ncbi:MAG TPA: hypothetical protein VLH86_01410 [Patescibacteria group bacterium]|nr:hypothetical protein [Patescibacteria group bacterium]